LRALALRSQIFDANLMRDRCEDDYSRPQQTTAAQYDIVQNQHSNLCDSEDATKKIRR
jgi:hypothetical protein